MRESAFQALIPIAFSAENIYQHLLCARSLMGNRDESDLVCAQEEREIIKVPLSPQRWLRPWDGVSGWAVRTPVLAGGPRDLRKELLPMAAVGWFLPLVLFPINEILLSNYLPSSTFETRIHQLPQNPPRSFPSLWVSQIMSITWVFWEYTTFTIFWGYCKWRTEIMYRKPLLWYLVYDTHGLKGVAVITITLKMMVLLKAVFCVASLTQKGSSWRYYGVTMSLTSAVMTAGLPWWLSGKEYPCQHRSLKRLRLNPWVRKIPWKRKWKPTPIFSPGESHGQWSLAGYSPWGSKELSNLTKFSSDNWAAEHAHTLWPLQVPLLYCYCYSYLYGCCYYYLDCVEVHSELFVECLLCNRHWGFRFKSTQAWFLPSGWLCWYRTERWKQVNSITK